MKFRTVSLTEAYEDGGGGLVGKIKDDPQFLFSILLNNSLYLDAVAGEDDDQSAKRIKLEHPR